MLSLSPSPTTSTSAFDHSTRGCTPPLRGSTPHSALAAHVQEARHSLRQLKQAAGGAGEAAQHFPMVHVGSTTPVVIEPPAAEDEPPPPPEPAVPPPQQLIDADPPSHQSFMDKMSGKLGSSTASTSDSESEDGLPHIEALPPPAPRVGGDA
ncbi:hypothetical protein CYMTET_23125 [Cymbomonas tetramitiformis]|uniref:Uncharacterized protein n=1 Tax=Cymbomonas tetramitiformis TaxID=36881 RepID=A0AAE0L1I5_9CHLO|nr:hypothetical protein CYMTET_23125 [Cymbomonas tetramitiformis]